jgi:tyrosyl-tRNA synthetase
VKLEGDTVTDPALLVLPDEGQTLRLSLGKKKHALVRR